MVVLLVVVLVFVNVIWGLLGISGGGDYGGSIEEPSHLKPLMVAPYCSFVFSVNSRYFRDLVSLIFMLCLMDDASLLISYYITI
jgi:hypothetical protein